MEKKYKEYNTEQGDTVDISYATYIIIMLEIIHIMYLIVIAILLK
jgi:hypothetical protein